MTPSATATPIADARRPARLGPFDVSNEDNTRWLTIRSGGNPESFGDAYLALGLAMRAVHGALEIMGVGPALGPAPAMLVLPHPVFCKLRDALVAEGKGGDHMFKRPRRKRVDPNRLVTMLGGITIASDLAACEVNLAAPRCPMRAESKGARA